MTKLFWHQYIQIEEIKTKLDEHDLEEKHQAELLQLVHETFNARIMETILSNLPEEKHQSFLNKFAKKPHSPKLLKSLKKEVKDIEKQITSLIKDLRKKILHELKIG